MVDGAQRGVSWNKRFADWLASDEANVKGEWRAFCPLHENPETSESPSASFNFTKGTWKCFNNCPNMSLSALWETLVQQGKVKPEAPTARRKRKKSADDPPDPLPTQDEVEAWHKHLLSTPDLLRVMTEDRGLTKAVLRKHRIGWHRGRYTIPVYDEDGDLCNVRRYLPGQADPSKKMWSINGHGSARLFLPDVAAKYREVVICEGEMDALCAQSHGVTNAMSHTGGSGVFFMEWARAFADKVVFLCYDVDDSGRNGALKAAEVLSKTARTVCIVRLPMSKRGADVTDYFVKQGHGKEDFLALLEGARERPHYDSEQRTILPTPKRVSLEDSQDARYGTHPLEIVATVAGKQTPAFIIPKRLAYKCDMNWNERCNVCPMMARQGSHEVLVEPHDERILSIVGFTDQNKTNVINEMVGIPKNCPRVQHTSEENYSVEELILRPSVEHRSEEGEQPNPRRALLVGSHDTPVNAVARVVAKSLPDPRDQRGVLLAWECEPVQTDLDTFKLDAEMVQQLRVFQPEPGQAPIDKMEDVAEDLAANVTHIYGRPELHMAYDAVWHSVTDFKFNNVRVGKGWLELVVVGDTRTGKSEAAAQMSRHYGTGTVQTCEGMTFAGLVGGVQQIGGRHWMITWGVIPLNDRRLVVLDEFGGIADKGVIEQMSSIRSSGRAQITKIHSDETSARTRLIWIANPLDGKSLAELHQPGISALQTLVKNPEDIARFDLAMACASGDVDPHLINSVHHDPVPHVYTQELCGMLVQWAWSRKVDDVVFRPGVEQAIVERANELGGRYVPEPPLIQVENVRVKLARIAVAVAACTFSTDRMGRKVVVRMQHVESAIALLDRLYGMRSFAYLHASRRIISTRRKAKDKLLAARKYLRVERDSVTATLLQVRNNVGFKMQDFKIFGSMDDAEAQAAMKTLTQMGMIRGISHGKLKIEPPLMELLQELEDAEDKA